MKNLIYLGLTLLVSNLTMNAQAQLTVSNPTPLCVGGSALLTAGGASTYVWSPATGLSATTGATVKATPSVTTTYTVTGTTASGTSTAQVTVIVDPTCSPVCPATGGNGSFNWVGLAHYYTADSTLNDLIGNANLVNLNSAGYGPGIIGKGFTMNGNNQYFLFPNNTFNPTGDFTISMWFKADALNGTSMYLYNNAPSGFNVVIDAAKQIYNEVNGNGNYQIVGTTVLSPSTWYHVLLVQQSGTRISIYINNKLEAYLAGEPNPTYNASQIQCLGAFGYTNSSASFSNFFTGTIDEVALFNRAITQQERAALYNGGAGKQAPY